MIRFTAGALALALAAAPAQPAPVDPAVPRLLQQAPPDTRATVRTVQVRRPDGTSFPVDVYTGPGDGRRPTLIFLSGTDDPRHWNVYKDYGRLAVARGFTAVVPAKRYARASLEAFTNGREDTMTLLRGLADLPGADPARSCLWAFSGGGPMISTAYAADAVAVDCVVAFYPVLQTPVGDDAFRAVQSPVEALKAGTAAPPMLLVRAGKDSAFLNGTIAAFADAALAENLEFTLVNLPDGVHAFDIFDDQPWSRAAILRAFDFAREHAR